MLNNYMSCLLNIWVQMHITGRQGKNHVMIEHGSLQCIIRRLTVLLIQWLRRNFVKLLVLSESYFVYDCFWDGCQC